MNPLFNAMNGNKNPQNNMLQAFMEFKNTFTGDPEKQVQQLLNSGKMSQEQYNQLAQMANGLMSVLK